jgi:gamma-glutamyltranspeptidase
MEKVCRFSLIGEIEHPVLADWNGYRVITAPPPSSGGIGLVQLLKMKADLRAYA